MVKGYTQKYGQDYDETFLPVVWYSSVRTLSSFEVQNGMMIHQMDVVTAFLKWNIGGRNLHGAATRVCQGRRKRSRLQIEKITKTVFQMLEHSLQETHGVY